MREQVHPRDKSRSSYQHKCGFWVGTENDGTRIRNGFVRKTMGEPVNGIPQTGTNTSAIGLALQAYLDAVGVTILPPRVQQEALIDIYFTSIHPILPVLNHAAFTSCYAEATEPRLLLQAICIVASKHDRARPHLILPDDPAPQNPRAFAKKLYDAVVAVIGANLERDRVVLIQVLALLSLYVEASAGAEQSSMHLAQAIHHAHTFALQFDQVSRPSNNASLRTLFWCLWSLDKLNASINGRPLIMHDRDNHLESPTSRPEERHTAFGIWLQLAEALDKVITFYRPMTDNAVTGWEQDFPGFEDMIADVGDKLDTPTIGMNLRVFSLSPNC